MRMLSNYEKKKRKSKGLTGNADIEKKLYAMGHQGTDEGEDGVNALAPPAKRSKDGCWYCGSKDHIRRDCHAYTQALNAGTVSRAPNRGRGGRSSGRGGRGRGRGRGANRGRGAGRSGRGSSRPPPGRMAYAEVINLLQAVQGGPHQAGNGTSGPAALPSEEATSTPSQGNY